MRISDLITVLASVMTGLALFAIAAGGVTAALIHGYSGDMRSTVIVLAIAVAAILLSLMFLLPSWARRVRQSGRDRVTRVKMQAGAGLLLCVMTLAFLMAMVPQEDFVLGIFPRTWLPMSFVVFVPLFWVALIFPGLAYRARDLPQPRDDASIERATTDGPPSKRLALRKVAMTAVAASMVRSWRSLKAWRLAGKVTAAPSERTWPHLKPGPLLHVFIWLTLLPALGALFAKSAANVIPSPAGLDTVSLPARLAFLAIALPLTVLIVRSPMSHAAMLAKRFVVKALAIIILIGMNGFWAAFLPQRLAPYLAQALHGSEQVTRRYTVESVRFDENRRANCRGAVKVMLEPGDDRSFEVCRIPRALIDNVKPGQTIEFIGRHTEYGLIWTQVRLPETD